MTKRKQELSFKEEDLKDAIFNEYVITLPDFKASDTKNTTSEGKEEKYNEYLNIIREFRYFSEYTQDNRQIFSFLIILGIRKDDIKYLATILKSLGIVAMTREIIDHKMIFPIVYTECEALELPDECFDDNFKDDVIRVYHTIEETVCSYVFSAYPLLYNIQGAYGHNRYNISITSKASKEGEYDPTLQNNNYLLGHHFFRISADENILSKSDSERPSPEVFINKRIIELRKKIIQALSDRLNANSVVNVAYFSELILTLIPLVKMIEVRFNEDFLEDCESKFDFETYKYDKDNDKDDDAYNFVANYIHNSSKGDKQTQYEKFKDTLGLNFEISNSVNLFNDILTKGFDDTIFGSMINISQYNPDYILYEAKQSDGEAKTFAYDVSKCRPDKTSSDRDSPEKYLNIDLGKVKDIDKRVNNTVIINSLTNSDCTKKEYYKLDKATNMLTVTRNEYNKNMGTVVPMFDNKSNYGMIHIGLDNAKKSADPIFNDYKTLFDIFCNIVFGKSKAALVLHNDSDLKALKEMYAVESVAKIRGHGKNSDPIIDKTKGGQQTTILNKILKFVLITILIILVIVLIYNVVKLIRIMKCKYECGYRNYLLDKIKEIQEKREEKKAVQYASK